MSESHEERKLRLAKVFEEHDITFSDCVHYFGADESNSYVAVARGMQEDGEVEIDSTAVVSGSDGNGDYVMAWVWVSNIDCRDKGYAVPYSEEELEDTPDDEIHLLSLLQTPCEVLRTHFPKGYSRLLRWKSTQLGVDLPVLSTIPLDRESILGNDPGVCPGRTESCQPTDL